MMRKFQGPWRLSELINEPNSPVPLEKGCYLVSLPVNLYNKDKHGPSRFIYIGGMTQGKTSSLSKRLGEFIAAVFGFRVYHGPGKRFFDEKDEHQINPWKLEFWWCVCDDPKCGEVRIFEVFLKDFNRQKPLLNRNVPRVGCQQNTLHNIRFHLPWQ